jgi:hypothetical protein
MCRYRSWSNAMLGDHPVRGGQRLLEQGVDVRGAAVAGAAPVLATADDDRVAAVSVRTSSLRVVVS